MQYFGQIMMHNSYCLEKDNIQRSLPGSRNGERPQDNVVRVCRNDSRKALKIELSGEGMIRAG